MRWIFSLIFPFYAAYRCVPRVEAVCWGGAAIAKALNREMDSRVYTRFIPLVGGVLDGWTGSSVVGAPGLRECGGKMPMRYDKTFETLADMSARFVQFREGLLCYEGQG